MAILPRFAVVIFSNEKPKPTCAVVSTAWIVNGASDKEIYVVS